MPAARPRGRRGGRPARSAGELARRPCLRGLAVEKDRRELPAADRRGMAYAAGDKFRDDGLPVDENDPSKRWLARYERESDRSAAAPRLMRCVYRKECEIFSHEDWTGIFDLPVGQPGNNGGWEAQQLPAMPTS